MIRILLLLLVIGILFWRLDRFMRLLSRGSRRSQDVANAGKMTVDEAYDVLGLKPGASPETIIAAHKRLMQKVHPDRGGSAYLAARINLAKTLLLKR